MRITGALGDAPGPYLSAAEIIAAGADALGEAGLARDGTRFRQMSEEIAQAAQIEDDGAGDQPEAGEGPLARDRRVITSLQRAAKTGSVRAGVQLAPALRLIADQLLARGLMELAYAAALGQRDGLSISAADAVEPPRLRLASDPRSGNPMAVAGRWKRRAAAMARRRFAAEPGRRIVGVLAGAALAQAADASRPTLGEADRRSFIEAVALVAPSSLKDRTATPSPRRSAGGAPAVERLRTPAEALALGDRAGLSAVRRSLLAWVIAHDPTRSAVFLSPTELLWLGLEDGARPADWTRGVLRPARATDASVCDGRSRSRELFAGRWNTGMIASAASPI